jgi:hypothetical protein
LEYDIDNAGRGWMGYRYCWRGVGERRVGRYRGTGVGTVGTVAVLVLYDREYDRVGSGKKSMVEWLLVGSI